MSLPAGSGPDGSGSAGSSSNGSGPDGSGPNGEVVRAAIAAAHRDEWAAVLAATARVTGDLGLAEDCTQDAYVSALGSWLRDGIPRSPGAWLTTAARRKALDLLRRDQVLRRKLPLLAADADDPEPEPSVDSADSPNFSDDRLRLIFTCCHPALAREAQVALTLRLVCGVSVSDIAKAFLVSETTMAARVTRAKKKIAAARIPYRVPAGHELADRLDAVLTVLHLVFTTGHTAPTGERLVRVELIERAVSLTRLLATLMPDEREVRGLLALILLTDARSATRVDPAGQPVLLDEQDRSQWNRPMIDEGRQLLISALRGPRPGRFVLQAAIAALHAEAPSYAETDWAQIVGCYDLLLAAWPSPVVALNRAVAVALKDGPDAGLAAIDAIEAAPLAGYHYLPAARADLLHRLGRDDEAAEHYRRAHALAGNEAEQAWLAARLAALDPSDKPG